MAETRPLRIPVILGTTRSGRQSAHAARFVHGEIARRDGVATELIDIAELSIPVDGAGEEVQDPRYGEAFTLALDKVAHYYLEYLL